MTLDHTSLGPGDVRSVVAAGVSRQAIQEAMEVAFLFNIYDRLADAIGWGVPAPACPVKLTLTIVVTPATVSRT